MAYETYWRKSKFNDIPTVLVMGIFVAMESFLSVEESQSCR